MNDKHQAIRVKEHSKDVRSIQSQVIIESDEECSQTIQNQRQLTKCGGMKPSALHVKNKDGEQEHMNTLFIFN